MEFLEIRGGVGFEIFRLLLSWVVGKIRGGVVDEVSKFEGGVGFVEKCHAYFSRGHACEKAKMRVSHTRCV